VVLAAGTAAFGKLSANSGVTIGAVEIAAAQTLSTVTNLSQLGGAAIAMGTGVRSAGTQRVTIATDDVVPVSGTVSVTGVALDATLTGGTQQSKITDGTNVATVKAASTAAGAADKALVVAISPNNTVPVSLATNTPTIAAGTAIIGKVGIDQTTPGTTNLVALAANQSINNAQINGVTPLMGNGVTGTGSQRVTIASDNTAFSVNATLQTGANVIGALTANQTVNVAQMNGVTVTMGNGVAGTGVQRVTLASDSTGQVALAAGSATIGALTANQSVNNAQVAGVATATGNGVVGTGVQRVAIASDNTAFSVNSTGTGNIAHDGVDSGAVPSRSAAMLQPPPRPMSPMAIGSTSWYSLGGAAMMSPVLAGDAGADGVTNTPLVAIDANGNVQRYKVRPEVYNGSTWDMQRGMGGNATTGDTGAKTATGNGATQTNVGNKGVQIVFQFGTVSGTSPTFVGKSRARSMAGPPGMIFPAPPLLRWSRPATSASSFIPASR
jgi:hypothetical protein